MIRILKADEVPLSQILNRDIRAEEDVSRIVDEILENVRKSGDAALFEYAEKLDRAKLTALEVTAAEIDAAWEAVDPHFQKTLAMARENIAAFHRRQLHDDFVITDQPGIVLGQRYTPIERVGVYVPGGTASYPSTVLMDVVPAKLAGVKEIIMVTPPAPDGSIKAEILAAAKVAGVDRIFKLGGAGAVAALAYGTQSVPRVDKIVGPGNIFVATAKRKVFGLVDIDMIAGPSEILVVADGGCNPAWVAADLLSQAEHDKLASAVLLTDSMAQAQAISCEMERQAKLLPRWDIIKESVANYGCAIVFDDLKDACRMADVVAPEHLEVVTAAPRELLPYLHNAGAIFLGQYAPEPLGDYMAGPCHVLPTSGTARFFSPLSTDTFLKKTSVIEYTRDALESYAQDIIALAQSEHLDAHANSIAVRFAEENNDENR